MKLFFISVLFILSISDASSNETKNELLLRELDETIAQSSTYTAHKEQKLIILKVMLNKPDITIENKVDLLRQLILEYESYQTDSSIVYINLLLDLGKETQTTSYIEEANVRKGIVFSINGMYLEAYNLLSLYSGKEISDYVKRDYYTAWGKFYEYLSQNATGDDYKKKYQEMSKLYNDTAFTFLNEDSEPYIIIHSSRLIHSGKIDEALEILLPFYELLPPKSHASAIVAYLLAIAYREMNNPELTKRYFMLSAISDIKGAIKENASLKELAVILFNEDDVNHAYQYIKHSLEDAFFCNAKHRQVAISDALPIINKAYQAKINKQRKSLILLALILSVSLLVLFLLIIYVKRQNSRLTHAQNEILKANNELKKLNKELSSTNLQIITSNNKLREANHIKEEYVGHFINLCSVYIDKLDDYRKLVIRMVISNQIEKLLSKAKSKRLIEEELNDFHSIFDNTFLHLFPTFVEELNALLIEQERYNFTKGDSLNTELRIFALIRLGISDSNKIARFLRFNHQTVYNYRSKIRNKARVDRDSFENMLMKIGAPAVNENSENVN